MKKLVSLLIAIILLSSALAGCDFSIIDGASTTNTTKPLFPENPIIEYGDNFTQVDIDFLMHLHGQKMGRESGDKIFYILYEIMDNREKLHMDHFMIILSLGTK